MKFQISQTVIVLDTEYKPAGTAVIRSLNREEIINKSPFEKIKMCKESPNKKFLTITQIVEFSKVDLSKSPSLIFYRDFFLFCIYTGLSFTDAINLSD